VELLPIIQRGKFMAQKIKIREIECKSAIGKCGFPGGGFCINPYVGCGHSCVYCYSRFMKRFTGHTEEWGDFVDVRLNIAETLEKQLKSSKYRGQQIYIGTVTDPYQPLERKYKLTRGVLKVLLNYKNPVSVLTKSDLVLRDIDLLKQFKEIDVNFTVNTLDEKWKKLVEPNSSTIKQRLQAIKKLTDQGITVLTMMGPYWPVFTEPETLFREFKKAGVSHVFTESFNTVGGNWTGVEKVLRKYYPQFLVEMRETLFNKKKFYEFYSEAQNKVKQLSKKYKIPVTIYFGLGHAAKFIK
jgi:DNA repair photolyase